MKIMEEDNKKTQFGNFFSTDNNNKTINEMPVQFRKPKSFLDVEEIMDNLKANRTVITYLDQVAEETKVRVLDILSGAIYALNGSMMQIEKDCFLFTPAGVNNPYLK